MHFIKSTTFLGALALGASALPAGSTSSSSSSSFPDIKKTSELWGDEKDLVQLEPVESTVQRRDDLEKRCSFNDGHGDIDCGFWSITFEKVDNRSPAPGDPTPVVLESGNKIVMTGEHWQQEHWLDCNELGERWNSVPSPLEWTVDIHPKAACRQDIFSWFGETNQWRGATVNYGAEHVLLASDTRCGVIDGGGWRRRCIIAVNP